MANNRDSFEKIGMAIDQLANLAPGAPAAGGMFTAGDGAYQGGGKFFISKRDSDRDGIGIVCTKDAARNLWAISAALEDAAGDLRPTESIRLWADSFPNGLRVFDVKEEKGTDGMSQTGLDAWADEEDGAKFENNLVVIDESTIRFVSSLYQDQVEDFVGMVWDKNDFLEMVERVVDSETQKP